MDVAWNQVIESLGMDLKKDISEEIRAESIIGITKDKEARRVFKIDTSADLPPPLEASQLFPLPVRNGVYRLVRGKGFEELETIDGSAKQYVSKLDFGLATSSSSEGESAFVHYCHNSGLLERFAGITPLYKTNEGRFRARGFSFSVGQVGPILQQGVQCQVDGLFEGKERIVIMEAKTKENPDFIIRQLYYPFRHFREVSEKPSELYFMRTDLQSMTYFFWQYRFRSVEDYSSIELVRKEKFSIVEKPHDGKELNASRRKSSIEYVPQANSVDTIRAIPALIEEGHRSSRSLAGAIGFTPRQALYYSEAAEALGLIERRKEGRGAIHLELTPMGRRYTAATQDERNRMVVEQMLRLPIMRRVWDSMEEKAAFGGSLSIGEIASIIETDSRLTGATPLRRASTVYRWLEWISRNYGVVSVNDNRLQFWRSS